MKMLGTQHKMDNREMIISYLVSEEGSVILTDKQKELMHRWDTADDLMRGQRYAPKEVAQLLTKKFDCSPATAWRYMEDASYVYGSTRKTSKNYLLALHAERIQTAIVLAEKQGKKDILPKLYDAYTKAISLLPSETKDNPAPTAIVFSISAEQAGGFLKKDLSPADAARIAEEKLKAKGVYVDFEEILKNV